MRLFLALTLAVVVAVPAAAQQGQPDRPAQPPRPERPTMPPDHPMMGGGMMGGGMMGMMARHEMMSVGSPGMILHLRESLDLSDDQVTRITALHRQARDQMQQHMQQAMQAYQKADAAIGADAPDLKAYESALREAADHAIAAHVAMAHAAVDARQVLNATQRQKLEAGMQMMREMRDDMDDGGEMPPGHPPMPGMPMKAPPRQGT